MACGCAQGSLHGAAGVIPDLQRTKIKATWTAPSSSTPVSADGVCGVCSRGQPVQRPGKRRSQLEPRTQWLSQAACSGRFPGEALA